MTSDEFALLAQRLGANVHTKTIFDTVQFRVGAKAFATLGWPEQGWAVVKIDPRRQVWALRLSDGLGTEPGRRRNAGIVLARLAALDEAAATELLAAAWRHAQGGQGRARDGARHAATTTSVLIA